MPTYSHTALNPKRKTSARNLGNRHDKTEEENAYIPMYGLVPALERMTPLSGTKLATLKSAKWTWPSASMRTLSGLMSRCITPIEWMLSLIHI